MIEYTCKHCDPYSGQCYVNSGSSVEPIGIVHYQIGCGGKCEKYEKEEENMTKEEIRQAAQDWDGSGICTASEEGAFIAGVEWMQEKMIEKAGKWLSNNMFHSINNGVQINGICVSDFIGRFKQAMQNESK